MIVFAAIMPHPPMSIPNIGNAEDFKKLAKTLNAFEALRIGLEKADPDTIIIISPHAHLEPYSFVINSKSDLSGSLYKFGNNNAYEYKNNIKISNKIHYACKMNDDMPTTLVKNYLDHGTLIPLYHITKNFPPAGGPKIVHLSFSLMSYERHYRYGEIIQKVIDSTNCESKSPADFDCGRVAIIASGDLSHKVTPNSPAGFSPNAEAFNHSIIRFLGANDLTSLMNMEPDAISEAAECGLRSIIILLGILHEKKYKFELLSYEAPFGIGYLTARLL